MIILFDDGDAALRAREARKEPGSEVTLPGSSAGGSVGAGHYIGTRGRR
jgi:hypothetical protein